MEKTSKWASIYFIVLMTLGNYILLNLLVAIIVDGFESDDDEDEEVSQTIKKDDDITDNNSNVSPESIKINHNDALS